jgi:hydroxyethylthiazole kinase
MAAIAELAANAAVTATTGATDTVSDGRTTVRIANGHPHMARVTGMGCAAGALIAAFAAVEADRLVATVGALTGLGIAGEIAAERAHGPGTFAAHIIDALATLDAATIYARARLS